MFQSWLQVPGITKDNTALSQSKPNPVLQQIVDFLSRLED